MAKRKINQLYDYIYEYYKNHNDEMIELFDLIGFPMDIQIEDFDDIMLVKVVHSLMGIAIIVNSNRTILEVNDIELLASIKRKDFELCRLILLDYFYHAFISVNVKWVDAPNRLSRNLLIPIRNTVQDFICAVVSSFRATDRQEVQLYTPYISFKLTDNLNEIVANLSSSASLYPILSFMDTKPINITYGQLGDYEFKVKFGKVKYLSKPEKYCRNVIVTKAKGYGIYEDKIEDLYYYLEDPKSIELPFNFDDSSISELNQTIEVDYEISKLHYMGFDVDALIDDLVEEMFEDESESFEA